MRMMPSSSRLASTSSPTFGISRVISSGPSLVSRASTSYSSMWIEVSRSSLHDALGEDDRVLVVVALPRHERDEEVLAERQLARRRSTDRRRARRPRPRPSPSTHDRAVVDAGALVGAQELRQLVLVERAVLARGLTIVLAVDDARPYPSRLAQDDLAGVHRRRGAPCRCRRAAPTDAAAAPPGAACSSP